MLFNVNFSFNRLGFVYSRKRKGVIDLEEFEVVVGKRIGVMYGRMIRDDILYSVWMLN